jgi:regulator of sigma E protease
VGAGLASAKRFQSKELPLRPNELLPGVVLLGLVIFVHELGHFLVAKWRGIKVLRFSLGFGPALLKIVRGETEYRLSWIPLGGYVQMAGDSPTEDGRMPGTSEEFLSHPWPGRLAVAIAGPAANLITAYLVLVAVGIMGESIPDFPTTVGPTPDSSIVYKLGLREGDRITELSGTPVKSRIELGIANSHRSDSEPIELTLERGGQRIVIGVASQQRDPFFENLAPPRTPAIVGGVMTGMPAYRAGLKTGDWILAVNGRDVGSWDDLPPAMRSQVDKPVRLTIERGGQTFDITVTPMNATGAPGGAGMIGIERPAGLVYVQRFGVLESFGLAAGATLGQVVTVYRGMWLSASHFLYYRQYMGGPMFIVQAAGEQARHGIDYFLRFLAMINIAIMAFNLLPIPVLDGGHILLALIQAVRGRPLSVPAYLRFQKIGLVVIGTLFILIIANDPLRVLQRQRAIDKAPREKVVAPPVGR